MKTNEHVIDRALRVIAGLVLITLAATGTVGVWGWIGVLPLVTQRLAWQDRELHRHRSSGDRPRAVQNVDRCRSVFAQNLERRP